MSTAELILSVLLIVQTIAWMATDYRRFDPQGGDR